MSLPQLSLAKRQTLLNLNRSEKRNTCVLALQPFPSLHSLRSKPSDRRKRSKGVPKTHNAYEDKTSVFWEPITPLLSESDQITFATEYRVNGRAPRQPTVFTINKLPIEKPLGSLISHSPRQILPFSAISTQFSTKMNVSALFHSEPLKCFRSFARYSIPMLPKEAMEAPYFWKAKGGVLDAFQPHAPLSIALSLGKGSKAFGLRNMRSSASSVGEGKDFFACEAEVPFHCSFPRKRSERRSKRRNPLLLPTERERKKIIEVSLNTKAPDVSVFPGQFLVYGDNIGNNTVTTESGQVLYIDLEKTTIRKAQTVLIYSQASIAVFSEEWIKKGTPLMSLSYQKLVTGDIVQGLPKIEQFFEAPVLKDGTFWSGSLQAKLNQFFQEYKEGVNGACFPSIPLHTEGSVPKEEGAQLPSSSEPLLLPFRSEGKEEAMVPSSFASSFASFPREGAMERNLSFAGKGIRSSFFAELPREKRNECGDTNAKMPLAEAVRKGFSEIQRVLVEGIQRVYISQGVLIADKHLEVIVRQMTCKGRILYSGDTGFLRNELVSLDKIENVNQVIYGQKALYHPQVRGITDASLESESFLSAASFQETTRVLSRDAIIGKTDLMRGLKERVIVGELIQAGTGLANNSVYGLV